MAQTIGDIDEPSSTGPTFTEFATALIDLRNTISTAIQRVAQDAQPTLLALAGIDWQTVLSEIEELHPKSAAAMMRVFEHGWFFGWHDGLGNLFELVTSLTSAKDQDIDRIMIEYYTRNLDAFSDELGSHYPERRNPILAAKRAHRELQSDGFFLSVPVYIAQADGLLAQLTEMKMGLRDAPKAIRGRYGENTSALELLRPIIAINDSDFMLSSSQRESREKFDSLNRHQVLHGERSDYGTEANSLKAFSLLVFVGLHLPLISTSYTADLNATRIPAQNP